MHGHGPHLHYYYYSDRLLHERIATNNMHLWKAEGLSSSLNAATQLHLRA